MKIVLLSTSLLLASLCFSQENDIAKVDRFKAGFYMGGNYSIRFVENDYNTSVSVRNAPGFTLGVLADYKLSNRFIASPSAGISFNGGEIAVTNIDGTDYNYELMGISLDFAANFRFSMGNGKAKPYLLTGPYIKVPIQKNMNISTEFPTRTDIGFNAGFGLDLNCKYFELAPEIRYSFGLLNVTKHPAISSAKFHSISLILSFKG